PSTRSPFCAPIASVISASRNSSITVRTIGRRKSPSSAIIALISLVVLLLFFRVMVRYSLGCYLLPTAYHDLSLIVEPSGRYFQRQNQLLSGRVLRWNNSKPFWFVRAGGLGSTAYPLAARELSTSSARRLAAVRVSTPSVTKISRTCFFTVDSLLPRIVAISLFVLPWVSHSRVSATRGVKPSAVSSGLAESKLG